MPRPKPRKRSGAGRPSLSGDVGAGSSPVIRYRVSSDTLSRLRARAKGRSVHEAAREAMERDLKERP